MSDYLDYTFKELRAECKARGLKAGGSKDVLVDRLMDNDSGADVNPEIPCSTDPDPENPNFDLAGRWRRRPDNFIEWDKATGYKTAKVK